MFNRNMKSVVAAEVMNDISGRCLEPIEEGLFALQILIGGRFVEVEVLYRVETLRPYHLKHLPLLQFKVLTTCTSELPLVVVRPFRVLEVSREIRGSVWQFIGSIPDQQVVAAPESRPVRIKAANGLVFEGFEEGVFAVI